MKRSETVSALIPCHNSSSTLERVVASLRIQRPEILELIVLDDASMDATRELAKAAGTRVVFFPLQGGRGRSRALGMEVARGEFVLWCDSTNVMCPDFLRVALEWMEDPTVAAVCGGIRPWRARGPVGRWRARHLFRFEAGREVRVNLESPFATWGALVRRSAVLEVGNFNSALTQGEDLELGKRLVAAGWKIIGEPRIFVSSISENSLVQVLERFWRWGCAHEPRFDLVSYLRKVWFSLKIMAREDLRVGDPLGACISLLAPHYEMWLTWKWLCKKSQECSGLRKRST